MKTAIVPLISCFPSVQNGKGDAAVYSTGCCETKLIRFSPILEVKHVFIQAKIH